MNDATKITINKMHLQNLLSISHVQIYFSEKGYDTKEAIEFYVYYISREWKCPSTWKSAAFRWMIKLMIQDK